MRPQKTSLVVAAVIALAVSSVFFASVEVEAQSSQYQRKSSPKKAKSAGNSGGKVDISELEEKYWTQKDTEFKVVQNRLYSKEGRVGFSLGLGPIVNDGFSVGNVINGGISYYLDERHGFEFVYSHYDMAQSKMTSNFINDFGAVPDYNELDSYMGLQYHWVPIYAKLSLFDIQILYFDFVISPGFGVMDYTQKVNEDEGEDQKGSSPVVSLDISQKIYLNKSFSLNLGMHNRYLVSEVVRDASRPDETRNETQISTSLSVGLTFFFDAGLGKNKEEDKGGSQ